MSLDMTTTAAAQYLGVSQGTVRRWADAGSLPHRRTPGGQRRFNQSDLDAFLASLNVGPAQDEEKGAA